MPQKPNSENQMDQQNIIELRDVCKNYLVGMSVVKAVRNVSLEIKKGDFMAIVGPSGSGKSTIMNLIGALDLASEGNIFLDGQDIEKLSESELAKIRGKKIGFVFQTFNLIPTLTALENITLPMIFQDYSERERKERGKELLKDVGLEERAEHLPSELSGGERQRVAIARALSNNPEVILADEPTGNLDTKTGESILKILKELNEKGKTIILVTHDLEMAKKTKKIIELKDGGITK